MITERDLKDKKLFEQLSKYTFHNFKFNNDCYMEGIKYTSSMFKKIQLIDDDFSHYIVGKDEINVHCLKLEDIVNDLSTIKMIAKLFFKVTDEFDYSNIKTNVIKSTNNVVNVEIKHFTKTITLVINENELVNIMFNFTTPYVIKSINETYMEEILLRNKYDVFNINHKIKTHIK